MSEPSETSDAGLTRQSVRAGTSLAVMTGIENLAILARTVFLSHLLLPREFGLMGMAFIAINTAEALTLTGFGDALVQRRGDPRPFLDTVWTFSALRGLGLSSIVFLAAPAIGAFFSTPEVVPVLRAVSAIMLLRGLSSPAWFLRERNLQMTSFYLPRLLCAIVEVVVTCLIALRWPSVWAMVAGFLCGTLVQFVGSYIVGPYVPRMRIDKGQLRELRVFGKHIFRQQLLGTFSEQADRLAVGRLQGAASLGLYTFASRLVTLPVQMINMIALRVILPAFARIQDEPQRVHDAFLRLMGLIALISFPIAAGMLATGPELVSTFFGAEWSAMTPTFRILSVLCAVRTLELACGFVASGVGRPDLAVRASILKLVLMGILIVPGILQFDIEGAAAAVVAGSLTSTLYLMSGVARLVGAGFRPYAACFGIPLVSCALMLAIVIAVRAGAPPLPGPALLSLLVLTGIAVYSASVALLDRIQGAGLATMLLGILRAR